MTLDDVSQLADLMLAKKVRVARWGDVELRLDPAAFAPDPMSNVPAEFREPPSDAELLYRSVEEGEQP